METYYIGDSCICWSLHDKIDEKINKQVLFIYQTLKESSLFKELKILDLVPSYKSIAVYFNSCEINPIHLKAKISEFIEKTLGQFDESKLEKNSRKITLPVVYDGEDLQRIADLHKMTVREVIDRHKASVYQVAMVGFKPYFPYLIGLDKAITTPRLDSPRTKVPAGSVAIGGEQTGIYPEDSPGGWNIVGRTKIELLKAIKPGDIVVMEEKETL